MKAALTAEVLIERQEVRYPVRKLRLMGQQGLVATIEMSSAGPDLAPLARYRLTLEQIDDPCACGAESQPEGLDDGHAIWCKAALRAEMRKMVREEMGK